MSDPNLPADVDWTFINLLALFEAQYPQFMPWIKQPGVLQILIDANKDKTAWPPERINAAMMNLPWFKNTPVNQRSFYFYSITDPATARQTAEEADRKVRSIAGQLGIPPTGVYDTLFILQAAAEGWDDGRIRAELIGRSSGNTPVGAGAIGAQMTSYKSMAADMGIRINDNDLYWWAANTQGGTVTQEGFQDYLTDQAINLYPALRPSLERGITVAQYAQPYFALATQELGINPAQIDLLNPAWAELFLSTNDKGEQTIRSMNDALKTIRTDPRYGYDKGIPGQTEGARLSTMILKEFGAIG